MAWQYTLTDAVEIFRRVYSPIQYVLAQLTHMKHRNSEIRHVILVFC